MLTSPASLFIPNTSAPSLDRASFRFNIGDRLDRRVPTESAVTVVPENFKGMAPPGGTPLVVAALGVVALVVAALGVAAMGVAEAAVLVLVPLASEEVEEEGASTPGKAKGRGGGGGGSGWRWR